MKVLSKWYLDGSRKQWVSLKTIKRRLRGEREIRFYLKSYSDNYLEMDKAGAILSP